MSALHRYKGLWFFCNLLLGEQWDFFLVPATHHGFVRMLYPQSNYLWCREIPNLSLKPIFNIGPIPYK